jgi:hypothetical protein
MMVSYSTTMTGLDDQAEVRREGALVGGACSLIVGVRTWQVVRELARALEHLALVIGSVGVFDFLCHCFDLIHIVRDTDKVTPGNAVKRMTGSADLLVHQVTSPDAGDGLP